MEALIAILGILFFVFVVFILPIASIAFTIWMVIDCAMNEPSEGNDKIVWILIQILLPPFGSIAYYFVRRPERIKKFGQ
ncbi:MAG: PLDc N-terminal domain-containing protein [Planctomycetaceae bacterium]